MIPHRSISIIIIIIIMAEQHRRLLSWAAFLASKRTEVLTGSPINHRTKNEDVASRGTQVMLHGMYTIYLP